tara:strand:+ start:1155 stop:1517 length:363 start_codon:yes stop_codon:yes gene_type:complete
VIFRAINAALALTPIAATGAVLAGLAAYRPAEEPLYVAPKDGMLSKETKARVLSEHSITPGFTPDELAALQPLFAVPPKARHQFDLHATEAMRAALVVKVSPPEPEPKAEPDAPKATSGH